MAIVQKGANEEEELASFGELRRRDWRRSFAEAAEPGADVRIAQTAGALFDVGLEVEEGIAIFGVASAGHFEEAGADFFAIAGDHLCQCSLDQACAERGIAGKGACVDKGERKLNVFRIEFFTFGECTGHGGDAQADIPKALV